MVGGKVQQGLRSGQLALPKFNFRGEYLAAHVLLLPLRVLRVLQRKVWQVRYLVLCDGHVGLRHFAEKQRDRPAVGNNVMHRQEEEMRFPLKAYQNWPDQRSFS